MAAPRPVGLQFQLSQAALAKFTAAGVLAALTLFFLSTARRRGEPERLWWAVLSALAALAVLLL